MTISMFWISQGRKNQLGAEAQQQIFVRQHQPPHALVQDQFEELIETFLAGVHPGAEIGDDFVPPALAAPNASSSSCWRVRSFFWWRLDTRA